MKHLVWYGLIALAIIAVYIGLTFWFDQQATQEHEAHFNDQQLLQTQLSAQSIEEHFQWVLSDLDLIATHRLPGYLAGTISHDEITTSTADIVQEVYPDEELLITYFDLNGDPDVIYSAARHQQVPTASLLHTWYTTYGDTVLTTGEMVVTPIDATADYQVYGVLLPVDLNGERAGVLGTVLDFAPVLDQYVIPMRSGKYGAAWVQDATSYVIYDHEPDTIGRWVTDLSQPYPDLHRVNNHLMAYDSGRDEYHYTVEIGGDVARKLVAWSTAHMGNQRLTIAMAAPDDEIVGALASLRYQGRVSGVLLGITLFISSGLFYLTRQRVLQRLVWHRTRELRKLNTRLERAVQERTAALAEKHSEVDVILAAMDDGVFFRRNGELIYQNPAIARLLGFTAEEIAADPRVVHAHIARDIPADQLERIQHTFGTALEKDTIQREDVLLTRKDGSTFYASIYMARVNDGDGNLVGTIEVIHDISHEMALQEQKDRFITNASHELRHPLANLKTRLYLLQHQPDQLENHLVVLNQAADDMARLVQDLVDVASFTRNLDQLDRKPISLGAVLENALFAQTALAERGQVRLETDLTHAPLLLHGDYQRLMQAFSHLIAHAIHITPTTGTVRITSALTTIQIDHTAARWAIVQVQDGGPVLNSTQLRMIFEPFFRPSVGTARSTGLGLTLAKHIIEKHRGTLTAEPVSEGGMRLIARLPLTSTEETPHPDTAAPHPMPAE